MSLASRRRWLWPAIGGVAFGLAAFLIYRALEDYSLDQIVRSFRLISPQHLLLGAAFTAGSFAALTGFDALGVRYTGCRLPYRRVALASFTALSIGHTLGFAVLSSGAIRLRFYTAWGLTAGDVGRIVIFSGGTVLVGLCTIAGIGALAQPEIATRSLRLPPAAAALIGIALLAIPAAYLVACAWVRRSFRVWSFRLRLPPARLAAGQIAVGTFDAFMVAGVLHALLSASADIGYPSVAALYAIANGIAIVSHVPGGLGVIEAVVLSMFPRAEVVGALVAFRAIYFLVPFMLGLAVFGAYELRRRVRRGRDAAGRQPAGQRGD